MPGPTVSTILIGRPIGAVFEFLSEPEHLADWQAEVQWARRTTDGPMGVGAAFEHAIACDGQTRLVTGEVVAYEPPAQLAWLTDLDGLRVVTRISLEAVGTHTRLRLRRQAIGELEGDGSACAPLEDGLLRLRQALERRPAA
jgi:uncharacterized protein YndB with AHSA1/START domain